jgi:hypothetical protein
VTSAPYIFINQDLSEMRTKIDKKNKQRLKEIEDRKIEILMEIAEINNNYHGTILRLNAEYSRLDKEYYQLKLLIVI